MNKEMLITSLINEGWFYQENVFAQGLCEELLSEAQELSWQEAKIGKGAQRHLEQTIRSDSIHWLSNEPESRVQKNYLIQMNELMSLINQELFLGLKEFECHFARYQQSGFYKKHLDQHAGTNIRMLSTITYLNDVPEGGELIIYNKDNKEVIAAKIPPKRGSFICFLSNQIYHEVLPTQNDRYSLAGWFRTSVS
jgi:SM-20-related protein